MRKIRLILILGLFFATIFSSSAYSAEEYTDGFYTYIVEDGRAVITGLSASASGEILIPTSLGGYIVSGIDCYSFEFSGEITKITLPDSITDIRNNTFYGCDFVKSIILGNGIKKIPDWAFYGCSSLESVVIGSGVSEIADTAFENLSALKEITVSEGNVSYYSQDGVLFLKKDKKLLCYPQGKTETSYIVDANTEIISDEAFVNSSLNEITIPVAVKDISYGAFNNCEKLKSINVASDNICYSSEDGVLFDKNKTSIIAYPQNKDGESYIFPESVLTVSDYAFYNCDKLKCVETGKKLEKIGEYGFYGCENLSSVILKDNLNTIGESAFALSASLKEITLPEKITEIDKYSFVGCIGLKELTLFETMNFIDVSAFGYCNAITDVNYAGNQTEWNNIDLTFGNDSVSGAQINYNKFIYIDLTVSEQDENTLLITAKMKNPPTDGYVYVAGFKGTAMSEIKKLSDDLTATLKKENAETIKLFVWNKNLSPLK